MSESLLIKLQTGERQILLRKRLWHMCFPVNFYYIFKNIHFAVQLLTLNSDICLKFRRFSGWYVSGYIFTRNICSNFNFFIAYDSAYSKVIIDGATVSIFHREGYLFFSKYHWGGKEADAHFTAQKMKFSIKNFFSKCDQRIWSLYWRNP